MDPIQNFYNMIPVVQVGIGAIAMLFIILLGLGRKFNLMMGVFAIATGAIMILYMIGGQPGGPYYSSSINAPQATQVAGASLNF